MKFPHTNKRYQFIMGNAAQDMYSKNEKSSKHLFPEMLCYFCETVLMNINIYSCIV